MRFRFPVHRFALVVLLASLAGCGGGEPPIESLPAEQRPTNYVEGEVRLDPALASKVERGDVLYILLRQPVEGGGQTGALVAAVEARSVKFPYPFVITDKNARSASQFKGPMTLHALLSKGGTATPRVGDLQGAFPGNPVEPGRRGLVVEINEVVETDAQPPAAASTVASGDGAAPGASTASAQAAPAGAIVETARDTVEGVVVVSPDLAASVDPHAPLFVFVRSPAMPGPPLAMMKIDHPTFPATFSLSKENMVFTNLEFKAPMTLHARLSKSGSPVGQPGDLEGAFVGAEVVPGTAGYTVVLDKVVQEKRASSMDNRPPSAE